jgi:hypothetical protein
MKTGLSHAIRKNSLTLTRELSSVSVPVIHYWSHNVATEETVDFTVYREDDWFKAVPLLSKEQRITTGLPEELIFVYFNYCIADANDMEEDSLNVIKQIILELEGQELL